MPGQMKGICMKIVKTRQEMRQIASSIRKKGESIALVPTMGFLHDGHISLLREGRKQADNLVLSVFVNPIQFGQNEDLDSYPREMERDCRIALEHGVDLIFAPATEEMYPPGFQTRISTGELSYPLCGAKRPGHFDGVATVVAKLFNIITPDLAFFGRKDYQQLLVIKRMVADLDMPPRVIGMQIVREPDGLAMSSRNAYLSDAERERATALFRAIVKVRDMYGNGETRADTLCEAAMRIIEPESTGIDYIEFVDGETLEKVGTVSDGTLFAMAVRIGKTRLIDNTILGGEL